MHLRFLIAADRRLSPVVFNHRDFRGKRTTPDPLHTDYTTYPCASYDEFLTLFTHTVKNQPGAKIFPLVERFDPITGQRQKLTGQEIVFQPSDFTASESTAGTPARMDPAPGPHLCPSVPSVVNPSPSISPPVNPENPAILSKTQESLEARILASLPDGKKRTTGDLANTLGISKDAILEAVKSSPTTLQISGGHWIGPA